MQSTSWLVEFSDWPWNFYAIKSNLVCDSMCIAVVPMALVSVEINGGISTLMKIKY